MNHNQIRLTATPVALKWSGRTDPGRFRPNNEDAFLGLRFDAQEIHRLGKTGESLLESMDFVFAVSDGMGGARAGEHASRIAVEKILTLLPRSFQQAATRLEAGFGEALAELFDQIHRALRYVGGSYEECSGMETTLSLCWFTPGRMYFGHIGDSRIYHLSAQENRIRQLSHDDTHVGWLFRNGKISEREARTHPRRNALQKALGGGNQFITPQTGSVTYQTGDIFLLCTDGLVEGLYDNRLVELLRPVESAGTAAGPAHYLVEESVNKHGRDNTTALVIQVR